MCLDEISLHKNLQHNFVLSFYQFPQVFFTNKSIKIMFVIACKYSGIHKLHRCINIQILTVKRTNPGKILNSAMVLYSLQSGPG
jgi:hypothetical protein